MDMTDDDEDEDEDATVDIFVGAAAEDDENEVVLVDVDEAVVAFEDGADNDDDEEEENGDSAGNFFDEDVYFTTGPAAAVTVALGLGDAIVVCGGEDEGNDSDEDGGVSAVIGPAAAVDIDDTFELTLAFPSSSRSEDTSLLSDAPLSPASLPDLEGSKLARIGFLTESEDSEKLPLFDPPAQLPPSVLPPLPSSTPPLPATATEVVTTLSVGGCPSLSDDGIGGAETCCCCCWCTPPVVSCMVAVSWVIVLALSRTAASHVASR